MCFRKSLSIQTSVPSSDSRSWGVSWGLGLVVGESGSIQGWASPALRRPAVGAG